MKPMTELTPRQRACRTMLVGFALASTGLIAGCSSGAHAAATAPPGHVSSAVTAPATSDPPASSSPAPSSAAPTTAPGTDLSGSWQGSYDGAFTGTFSLTWTQSGSALSGNITLSRPAGTLSLTGTVDGTAITFGTVGSDNVTYTGTVASGSAMSGTYTVNGSPGGGWSATKS